nr:hypothetical protein [Tanacetum cinerariifolium]
MLEDPYVEVALQAPPFPDYIPGPEDPKQAPPSLDYVPGPEYVDDEIVAEDQPYAEDASPIAQSPEYVPESDFEAHPEDDDDEDHEEDPVDYPADGGDDGDDEEESSEDDEDDDMDIEADEEEEEKHPAPADSVVVASTAADQAPSTEETEPFETDESAATPPPHPAYRMTARISNPAPVHMPAWTDLEAASTSSPPLQLPSASHMEDRPEVTLPPQKRLGIALGPRYEVGESSSAAAARPTGVVAPTAADQAPSAEETEPFETDESAATPSPHPAYRTIDRISIPAPVPMPAWTDSEVVRLLAISSPPASPLSPWSSPPPQIPFPSLPPILSPHSPLPSASRREDRPEVTLPPQKRLDIAFGPRYEVGESSSAAAARPAGGLRAGYSFVTTVDREIMRDPEREVGYGITDSWDEIV